MTEPAGMASWISAAAESLIALGVALTYWQFRADHARSRRERAVELIGTWAKTLRQRASSARKLTEMLDHAQTTKLWNQESFKVEAAQLELVDSALAGKAPPALGGEITLTEEMSAEIRWQVVSYLNNLESILAAWRHNVADREMIAEQFRFLVSPKDGRDILEKFREISMEKASYPSIADFVHCVREKNLPDRGKGKL